ncbi:MAG: M20 family metallopeptidase [Veillonellales bacterium]
MLSYKFEISRYIRDLEYLVNIDSGSRDVEGIAKVTEFFARKFSEIGWKVKEHYFDPTAGPCLEIVNSDKNYYDILLMGHMDTVFETGTAAKRPFAIKDGRGYGPGIADCKGGLLAVFYVLSALRHEEKLNHLSIGVAFNSDEEISSIYSRPWLEMLAKKSECVLVVEPGRANGDFVNKRKGVGRYRLEINGVAAHSGIDHEKGRSAVEELAHWILALHSKTNYATGTTVNVGVVSAGTAVNVVAAQAKAEVDVRMYDPAEAQAVEQVMRDLAAHPRTSGVTAQVRGNVTRPPMIPSARTLELCDAMEHMGAELGIPINWTATGGGSDGSFAASLGIPTLDGLGPIGGGFHGPNEYLLIDSIEPRCKLLYRFIEYIAENNKNSR